MNRILISTVCIILLVSMGTAQREKDSAVSIMDFEKYDPPSSLVVPEHKLTAARFPFIDVHSHHFRGVDKSYLNKLRTEMDAMHMQIIVTSVVARETD